MERLSPKDVLVLHAMVIDATGGSHGVRDPHLLASLVEKPFAAFGGTDLYLTPHHKAAVLFEALVNYHVFVDGNKRTGLAATARFLAINGLGLTATNEDAVDMALRIATKDADIPAITEWLEAHSRSL